MNRSDHRAHVRAITNIYSTGLLSDADIDTALLNAHYRINGLHEWPWLLDTSTVTTVADTASYTLPADFVEALSLANQDRTAPRQLRAISLYEASTRPTDNPDRPTLYCTDTGSLLLYPTPSVAEDLTLVYRTTVPAYDSDDDTPPFDAEFHAIYSYSAAVDLLSEREGSPRKIESCVALVESLAERMRRRYVVSPDRGVVHFGSRRGF